MKIATKLWSFIILIIVAICMVAVIGLMRNSAILSEGRGKQATAEELVQITTEWNGLTTANAARTTAVLLSQGSQIGDAFKEPIATTTARVSELQKKIEDMPLWDDDKAQMQKIADLRKAMIAVREKAREAKKAGDEAGALQMLSSEFEPAMAAYIAGQKQMVELQKQHLIEINKDVESRRAANTAGILIGLAVIVLVIFAGTAWLVRSIREPLNLANNLAARIAEGDLTHSVHSDRTDEFGQLLHSLEAMNISLGRMVSEIRGGTDSIAIASAEIATGNNDLAQRTEQTSSNLQATASSMDGLTNTVQHSAESARQASALAANASMVAQRGSEVVTQVVSTMQEIDASSKKIADIISVIDGIAFQTNILALNAAVEAARAGEQGRGFAVVASEVRSLAGRSAEAAKEIKTLINASVERVEQGSTLVDKAGETMTEVVSSIRRVTDIMGEISAASSEQSAAVSQVGEAVTSMDQTTQQNAALVEEMAAAASSLKSQANDLVQVVAVFKL